jgi:hypothetical protein
VAQPTTNPRDSRRYNLYFARMISISRETELYEFDEFFSECGGYISVLIGLSLMDVVEYFFGLLDAKIEKLKT